MLISPILPKKYFSPAVVSLTKQNTTIRGLRSTIRLTRKLLGIKGGKRIGQQHLDDAEPTSQGRTDTHSPFPILLFLCAIYCLGHYLSSLLLLFSLFGFSLGFREDGPIRTSFSIFEAVSLQIHFGGNLPIWKLAPKGLDKTPAE